MGKNLFYEELKVLLKLWLVFGLFLSFAWVDSAYSWGSAKPKRNTSVKLLPPANEPTVASFMREETSFLPIVSPEHDEIAKALSSDFSLEQAGVKYLRLRIRENALFSVGFENNQMSQTSDTLIFRPGLPVVEMDAGGHIHSSRDAMPYCFMRVRKQDRSIPDEELALDRTAMSSDLWLPSPIRYQVYEDTVRLSIKFIDARSGGPTPATIQVEELECHFLSRDLSRANVYDVLRGVLGEHIEITYSME